MHASTELQIITSAKKSLVEKPERLDQDMASGKKINQVGKKRAHDWQKEATDAAADERVITRKSNGVLMLASNNLMSCRNV